MSDTGTAGPAEVPIRPRRRWRGRMILLFGVVLAGLVIWGTNQWMTQRLTEATRSQAEVRLASYSGNLRSELQRNAIVPLLLSRDPALIGALNSADYSQSTRRLISYRDEINAASIMLLDTEGRVVASTERERIEQSLRELPFFTSALRSNDTVFTTNVFDNGLTMFAYSRAVTNGPDPIGVIVVAADLRKFESSWAGFNDAVIVSDSGGTIILATESRWRGLDEETALTRRSAPSAIERALRATADWSVLPVDAYLGSTAVMRQEQRIGFQGWKIASFTTHESVRQRVNTVLALEVMGFASLLAFVFYLMNLKATSRLNFLRRESAELRALNERLQTEIAEREKAEKNLEVAEQTLQQSSKLAILGEMSAAVSHELNQPLAAMKTYLAGARLLLQRKRPNEALSSFQRIDDLIERMGAITRQLKSYARKGGDEFEDIDVRAAVSAAVEMMEPQLRRRKVKVGQTVPKSAVVIRGDRLRLEQVLINLIRNALDATRGEEVPEVEVLVTDGETVLIAVQDNGVGIEDLENLFEPFYTTKAPGDGVGLGLAISSGIVTDLGGRLTARNRASGGAVFEIRLPGRDKAIQAAE
ncbi:MAG: ATP-binding protein [Pseudomonadota bacterium]